jgi:hypothetical protein
VAAFCCSGWQHTWHLVAELIAFSTFILRGEFDPS